MGIKTNLTVAVVSSLATAGAIGIIGIYGLPAAKDYLLEQGQAEIVETLGLEDITDAINLLPEGIGNLVDREFSYSIPDEPVIQEVQMVPHKVIIGSSNAWTAPPEKLHEDYKPELSIISYHAIPFPEQKVFQAEPGSVSDEFFRKIDPFRMQIVTDVVTDYRDADFRDVETNAPPEDLEKVNGLVANLDTRGNVTLRQVDFHLNILTSYRYDTTPLPPDIGEFSGTTKEELINYFALLNSKGVRVENLNIDTLISPEVTYVASINEPFDTTLSFDEYNIIYQNPVTNAILDQQKFLALIKTFPGFNLLSLFTDDSIIAFVGGEDNYKGEIEGMKTVLLMADDIARDDGNLNTPYVVPEKVSQPMAAVDGDIREHIPEWYPDFLGNMNRYIGTIIDDKIQELSNASTNVSLDEEVAIHIPAPYMMNGIYINPVIAEPQVKILLQAPEELRYIIDTLDLGDVDVEYFSPNP